MMADADLDAVIRQLAKQQHRAVMAAAKKRRARLAGLAAKARGKDGKLRYAHLARETMLQAEAAARRLQLAADNAADSYARAMRQAAAAADDAAAKAAAQVAKPTKKSGKTSGKSAPGKPGRNKG